MPVWGHRLSLHKMWYFVYQELFALILIFKYCIKILDILITDFFHIWLLNFVPKQSALLTSPTSSPGQSPTKYLLMCQKVLPGPWYINWSHIQAFRALSFWFCLQFSHPTLLLYSGSHSFPTAKGLFTHSSSRSLPLETPALLQEAYNETANVM